jgi:hypothetical protein
MEKKNHHTFETTKWKKKITILLKPQNGKKKTRWA